MVIVIWLIAILTNISLSTRVYNYRNYSEISNIFKELNKTCSDYLTITTSQKKYNLDSPGLCNNEPCETIIVYMTDYTDFSYSKKQVFISGLLHGNEVIGANTLTELAIELCDIYSNKKDELQWIREILKRRLLIFTPMTNANGYYNQIREEKYNKMLIDPNRDFPYFQPDFRNPSQNCMKTIAARTVNEVFRESLIINSITFHGGTNVLGYVWGNFIHIMKNQSGIEVSTEAPDFNSAKELTDILKDYTSIKNKPANKEEIPNYVVGDMTSTVYAVDGGMEDWSYAGSWEKGPISTCNPNTYNSYSENKTKYDSVPNALRSMTLLAETHENKKPNVESLGSNENLFNDNFYGNIARNIRLSLSMTDFASPYILLKAYDKENKKLHLSGQGCITLNNIKLMSIEREKSYSIENANVIQEFIGEFDCYWKQQKDIILELNSSLNENLIYVLFIQSDRSWSNQNKPDPSIEPQSHLVRLRHNNYYFVNNENFQLFSENHSNQFTFVNSNLLELDCLKCEFKALKPFGKLMNSEEYEVAIAIDSYKHSLLSSTISIEFITDKFVISKINSIQICKFTNNCTSASLLIRKDKLSENKVIYYINSTIDEYIKHIHGNKIYYDNNLLGVISQSNFKGRYMTESSSCVVNIENYKSDIIVNFNKMSNYKYELSYSSPAQNQIKSIIMTINNIEYLLSNDSNKTIFDMSLVKDNNFNIPLNLIGNYFELKVKFFNKENSELQYCLLVNKPTEAKKEIEDGKSFTILIIISAVVFSILLVCFVTFLVFKINNYYKYKNKQEGSYEIKDKNENESNKI